MHFLFVQDTCVIDVNVHTHSASARGGRGEFPQFSKQSFQMKCSKGDFYYRMY